VSEPRFAAFYIQAARGEQNDQARCSRRASAITTIGEQRVSMAALQTGVSAKRVGLKNRYEPGGGT